MVQELARSETWTIEYCKHSMKSKNNKASQEHQSNSTNSKPIVKPFYFPNYYRELLSNKLRDYLAFCNLFFNEYCQSFKTIFSDPSFKKNEALRSLFAKYKNELNLYTGLSTAFQFYGKMVNEDLK